MDEKEELSRRQAAVKEFRSRYEVPLTIRAKSGEANELLEVFRERLEERGVKLNAEEVIMGIVLLETLVDVGADTDTPALQAGILTLLLEFVSELDSKWSDKDRRFFVE